MNKTKKELIEFRDNHYSWSNMGTDWRKTWQKQFNEFFGIDELTQAKQDGTLR